MTKRGGIPHAIMCGYRCCVLTAVLFGVLLSPRATLADCCVCSDGSFITCLSANGQCLACSAQGDCSATCTFIGRSVACCNASGAGDCSAFMCVENTPTPTVGPSHTPTATATETP